jgi:hypothetical protein
MNGAESVSFRIKIVFSIKQKAFFYCASELKKLQNERSGYHHEHHEFFKPFNAMMCVPIYELASWSGPTGSLK